VTRCSASALALVLVACADPPDRTPATCVDCGFSVGSGVGIPSSGGSGGEGAGGSGATAGEAVTLTGDVLLLDDFAFESGPLFPELTAIRVEGESGASVVGSWNGVDPFLIENVQFGAEVWLLATPPPNGLGLPTLGPLDTSEPNIEGVVTADVAVVSQGVIDTIFALLTVPVMRNEEQAVVLLGITDSDGDPLAGVTVTAREAEVVVYGANGTFSDLPTATDSSGLLVLGNVPASNWPGSLVAVTFSGELEGGVNVPVVTGGVTYELIRP